MRWFVWSLYLVVLSLGLLTPHSAALARTLVQDDSDRFTIGKTFHASAFAGLAILSAWLGVRPARRIWLLLGLSLYAAGTEFLQLYVPTRTGSLQDVTLNHTGLYLGVVLSWPWWSAPAKPIRSPSEEEVPRLDKP